MIKFKDIKQDLSKVKKVVIIDKNYNVIEHNVNSVYSHFLIKYDDFYVQDIEPVLSYGFYSENISSVSVNAILSITLKERV